MPTIRLTGPLQDYVQQQVRSGLYPDAEAVVQAGLRLLMERDGARGFAALKADLADAAAAAEAGAFAPFDPRAYEPDAFRP